MFRRKSSSRRAPVYRRRPQMWQKKKYNRVARIPRQVVVRQPGVGRPFPQRNQITKVRGPVADQAFVQLEYNSQLDFTPVTAAFNSINVWRANSIFDPDFTGAGDQPLYYDQYAALYGQYQVLACRFDHTVCTIDNGGSPSIPAFVSSAFTDVDPTGLNNEHISSLKFGQDHGIVTAATPLYISTYITMKQLHGYKDITQVDNLIAAIGGNPADPSFHILSIRTSASLGTDTYYVKTKITYYVKLFSLLNVAESS